MVSDHIGRRKAIFFGCLWGLLGSSLMASAQNANWMLCARVLAGVGTGIVTAVIPVWGSELVSHNNRGAVMAFEMVVNFAGISTSCPLLFLSDILWVLTSRTDWLEYLLAFINDGNTQVRWRRKCMNSKAGMRTLKLTTAPSTARLPDDVCIATICRQYVPDRDIDSCCFSWLLFHSCPKALGMLNSTHYEDYH